MQTKAYRATIAKDGSTAATRIGVNPFSISEIYNSLITMAWTKFALLLLILFLFLTLFFTGINSIVGFEHFNGFTSTRPLRRFLEIFIFNAQTLTTVGGTGIVPTGFTNSVVLTIESMTAMLGAAVITGLLYARFSKPSIGIIYSSNALVTPYRDNKALMFRIANAKKNEVVEMHIQVWLISNDLASTKREIKVLNLERSYMPFLAHSLTVVHPLNDQSPLKDFNWHDTEQTQFEIGVWINAIDRVTGQNVFSGQTYFMPNVLQGAKFKPCMDINEDGHFLIYLDKLNDHELI